eukprot:TRINITY_DN8668_c0_g1_i1.p1 TRINITY_DN8668_c0_g1~~TRINITY_DN8668_c0_g1_i1.p1  ORF type:complete len:424 (+),score=53.86 TRINITY_DN8668_c0_g1_i1:95-1366(+)
MSRRGQISIDKIVAVRSSVLPLYIILQQDGNVTAADEVSEDGNDFLTTKMHGDHISFQSIRGDYLSAEGDVVCTRRYCSADERFLVEKRETQYSFKTRTGMYLSMSDREPFVCLAAEAGDTEVFQLFSLMMCGVNVGKQLELLDRHGTVMVDNLLDDEQIEDLRRGISEAAACEPTPPFGHEVRVAGLAGRSVGLAQLTTHPLVMQLARRMVSSRLKLMDVESCRTDAAYVRTELETTSWHVMAPYGVVEFPGITDSRISFTAMWFVDDLDASNSTWAWVSAPRLDGDFMPRLPHLSSPEEVASVTQDAKPLHAKRGSALFYLGPMWMSNNVGAASFWKDYDAQTRYKHLSGQKEQSSFRALTDAQRNQQPKEELCPTLLQATYVREFVAPCCSFPTTCPGLTGSHARELEKLTSPLWPQQRP